MLFFDDVINVKEERIKFWTKYFSESKAGRYKHTKPHNRDYTTWSTGTTGLNFCIRISLDGASIDFQINPNKNEAKKAALQNTISYVVENQSELLELLGGGYTIESNGQRLKIRKDFSNIGSLANQDSWTDLVSHMLIAESHFENTLKAFFKVHRQNILAMKNIQPTQQLSTVL